MTVDICYIVSHGFASRMLLQTGLITKLTDAGHSVAIVSQNSEDENFTKFQDNANVHLEEWSQPSTIWDDDYLYKRMYFLEDIDKNTALKEKFYNALFYSSSKHPWKRVRPLYYYFIFRLIKFFPKIRERFIEKESSYLASKTAEVILEKLNPKMVVATYPVSIIEAKLLYESQRRNIKTVLHLLSWDNISCKGKFPVLADEFIVWGEIMKQELIEYYKINPSHISVCGVPHFDLHVEIRNSDVDRFLMDLEMDPSKPYLFFAMSSPRFAPKEMDIVEWLAQKVDEGFFGNNMQLVVRPHPQNVTEFTAKKSWLNRLKNIESNKVKVDYPLLAQSKIRWSLKQKDMEKLAALLSKCSICFNSGSTVSIDALFYNKPVVITSFDGGHKSPYWNSARRLKDYNHLKKFLNYGGAKSVLSYEELTKLINQILLNPSFDEEKRKETLYQQCYLDDGLSTERVASTLGQLLKNKRKRVEG